MLYLAALPSRVLTSGFRNIAKKSQCTECTRSANYLVPLAASIQYRTTMLRVQSIEASGFFHWYCHRTTFDGTDVGHRFVSLQSVDVGTNADSRLHLKCIASTDIDFLRVFHVSHSIHRLLFVGADHQIEPYLVVVTFPDILTFAFPTD